MDRAPERPASLLQEGESIGAGADGRKGPRGGPPGYRRYEGAVSPSGRAADARRYPLGEGNKLLRRN
jgi:hypothetical protein